MRNGYPFIDLHRHLDGNIRLETIIDLAQKHKISLPAWEKESFRPYVQVMDPEPDLLGFLSKFEWLTKILVDYDAVKRIARENLEDAVKEKIDYIELRFSPYFMALQHNLEPLGVTEAICEALQESQLPVKAKLIVIMSRTFGPEKCWQELEAAISCHKHGVVALDLAGDEKNYPGTLFRDHFSKAQEAGLEVIAHAGEAAGFESVRQAITELGVKRIGHGVRAMDDEATMQLILEKNIAIESCPTSNVQTSTVQSYQEHPLPLFLEKGLLVTLNTDDPSISGIDLEHEFQIAQQKMGLSAENLVTLQKNSLEAAFLSSSEKDQIWKPFGSPS